MGTTIHHEKPSWQSIYEAILKARKVGVDSTFEGTYGVVSVEESTLDTVGYQKQIWPKEECLSFVAGDLTHGRSFHVRGVVEESEKIEQNDKMIRFYLQDEQIYEIHFLNHPKATFGRGEYKPLDPMIKRMRESTVTWG